MMKRLFILIFLAGAALAFPTPGPSEVALDGSMGHSGPLSGPIYNIGADLGSQSGANLFHSFSYFSLTSGESAIFSGPSDIANIIGRVTGGEVSSIDGLIRSTISGADLYLLNPAGILFGPNASLDLGGSFYAATSDYLGFEDGMRFYALPLEGELLSSAPPNAFGFLEGPLGEISVTGPGELTGQDVNSPASGLKVGEGETLALIAGEISISNGAYTLLTENSPPVDGPPTDGPPTDGPPTDGPPTDGPPTDGPPTDGPPTDGPPIDGPPTDGPPPDRPPVDGPPPDRPPSGRHTGDAPSGAGPDVMAANGTEAPPSGEGDPSAEEGDSRKVRLGSLTAPGGTIVLAAVGSEGELLMTGNGPDTTSFVSMGNIEIMDNSQVNAGGEFSGDVFIRGGSFYMEDSTILNSNLGGGEGGVVDIRVQNALLTGGATVDAGTRGPGSGGTLILEVDERLTISGTGGAGNPSSLNVSSTGEDAGAGDAGGMRLHAGSVSLLDGGNITGQSLGGGRGGSVLLESSGDILISGGESGILLGTLSRAEGAGDAGNLDLTAKNLIITNGGEILSRAGGKGNAGEIKITADSVHIFESTEGGGAGKISSENTRDSNGGNGGALTFDVHDLTLEDGALISASTVGPGRGGNISISASGTLRLSGAGNGGFASNIQSTSRSLPLGDTGGGHSQAGPGGNIRIDARSILLSDGGNIGANTSALALGMKSGDAGTIDVTAESILVTGVNPYGENFDGLGSGFYAKSLGDRDSAGDAGSISIKTGSLLLENGGVVLTDTYGWADGGNIRIECSGNFLISGKGGEGVVLPGADSQNTFDKAALGNKHPGHSGVFANSVDMDLLSGNSGSVDIVAGNLSLAGEGRIMASSRGGGESGAIRIKANDSITLESGAVISTNSVNSGGGRMDLLARNRVSLTDSTMETNVLKGGEDGGDIHIDPEFVTLNNSRITANADAGDGGNIFIVADHFIASADSAVTASSNTGIDGEIVIDAPHVNLAAGLANLPVQYLDAAQWARTPCDQRRAGDISRFEIRKTEGVYTPLDDFREAMPPAGDAAVLAYMDKGDTAGLVEALENEPESVHGAVWRSAALQALGRLEEAREALESASGLFEASPDIRDKVLYLSRKGDLALLSHGKKAAIHNTKLGLKLAEESKDPVPAACLWNNLGNLRSVNRDYHGAAKAYKKSLRIAGAASGGKSLLPLMHTNLARLYLLSGKREAALREVAGAAEALKALEPGLAKARGWIALSHVAERLGKPASGVRDSLDEGLLEERFLEEGIFENALLEKGLLTAARIGEDRGWDRIQAQAFESLGQLYESEGRVDRALSAVGKAVFFAQKGTSPDLLFSALRRWGRLAGKKGNRAEAVLAYKQAVVTLGPIRMAYLNSFRAGDHVFEEKVRPVYLELADILMENPDLLAEARDTMELLKRAELQNYFQDECLTGADWKPFSRDALPPKTAILYPISFADNLSLLLMTRDSLESVQVPLGRHDLAETVSRFRKHLEEMGEARPMEARQLYDWIIRPISDKLMAGDVETLVVAPDGPLRPVPFGALVDGERFLIEKMAVATVFAAGLTDMEKGTDLETQALLNGLTIEKEGFAPLAHVSEELRAINGMVPGDVLLDEDFTKENLREKIDLLDYGILHMSTHAMFGGRADNSFLLTYDGRLYMDELKGLVGLATYRDLPLELLMLSACRTASGDEGSAFGLAGAALSAGARSTVATLWKTDDKAASMLVKEFYKGYKESGMGKAGALQAAQQKLLRDPRFHHPAFWAAFTLIGNWQ